MKVKIISSWRITKHPGLEPVSGAGPCPLAGLGSSTMSLVQAATTRTGVARKNQQELSQL